MAEKDLHYTIEDLKNLVKEKQLPVDPAELDREVLDLLLKLVGDTLMAENREYGSSFYQLRRDYEEYLPMRLTDKINRLRNLKKKNLDYTDTIVDIAGYAVLELYYLLLGI